MAPPFNEVEFDILYGTGISKEGDLIDLASEAEIVDKSGAWFSFAGERIGHGRENAKVFLIEHPSTMAAIEAKLLAHHNIRRIGVDVAEPTGEGSASDDKRAPSSASPPSSTSAPRPVGASATVPPGNNGRRPNA